MNPARLAQVYPRLKPFLANEGDLFLFVDTASQKLFLCRHTAIAGSFDISTSLRGVGNRSGSFKTPAGIHRIREKIGAGAPRGRIFRSREDTGIDWREDLTEENLILSRIMRLEGLEAGLNKGPGVDSFDRFIYLHGTNKEAMIGTPQSHGCILLRNLDCIKLFDAVQEGTIVFIDAASLPINDCLCSQVHFIGIIGSGMSAVAQYLAWVGVMVTGSDRLLASNDAGDVREKLLELGCNLFPQDGSGIGASTDAVCLSTAIEESNPDIVAARERNIAIFHRSDILAAIIASKKTIAVAGTSGKSTVTAMIFEFLTACGKMPSLISGAPLRRLEKEGLIGNAFFGTSDLLVVETDESDGTLVKYRPAATVFLNISRDHKNIEEVEAMFATLAARSEWTAANADDTGLDRLPVTLRFGTRSPGRPGATWKPDVIELDHASTMVQYRGITMRLPLRGAHNAENLCAALCVCEHFGCEPGELSKAAANFQGVARRFSVVLTPAGIYVVDDFAHNPAKIAAAVAAARGLSPRIIAVYQPHGFGPTRFLRDDYIATFRSIFGPSDALLLLPIYYAGGTVQKTIASEDLIAGLGNVPFVAETVANREALLEALANRAEPGDCILLMGARDPSLPALAESIARRLGETNTKRHLDRRSTTCSEYAPR
jgi:UDP-N-acetylmuramate--alanine ligase